MQRTKTPTTFPLSVKDTVTALHNSYIKEFALHAPKCYTKAQLITVALEQMQATYHAVLYITQHDMLDKYVAHMHHQELQERITAQRHARQMA